MPAESAGGEGDVGQQAEAGLAGRQGEGAAADAHGDADAARLEVRGLEVEAYAVLKAQERGAEVVDLLGLRDLAGLTETGVGERGRFDPGLRSDGDLAAGGVGGRNVLASVREGKVAGDEDLAAGRLVPDGAQRGGAIGGLEQGERGRVEGEVGGGMRGDGAVEQVIREIVGQRGRVARGGGVHGLLEVVVHLGDGLAQLVGLEAVLKGAAQLLLGDSERGRPLVGLAIQLDGGVAEEFELLGHADEAAEVGRPFLLGEDGQPAVEHAQRQRARQIFEAQGGGVGFESVGHDGLEGDIDAAGLGLGMQVGLDSFQYLDAAETRLGRGRGARGQRGEYFLHERRDRRGLDVAGDDHEHPLGAIPGVVELRELLARGVPDDVLQADWQPLREARVGHEEFQLGEEGAQADRVAGAFLTQDYAALLGDFRRVEGQAAGNVGEERQALAQGRGLRVGQLELIDGTVEIGRGVRVAAKIHAEALEELNHAGRREMPAAVEGHVLEEVGEPALVLALLERADLHGETEAHAALGLLVVDEGVAQAVVEPAPPDGGIHGEVARFVGEAGGERQQRGEDERGKNGQGKTGGAGPFGGRRAGQGHAGEVFRPARGLQVSSEGNFTSNNAI